MDPALAAPIASLPGANRRAVEGVAKLGLRTVADLLFHFPRDYEDFSDRRGVAQLEEDAPQTVVGVVTEVDARGSGFGKHRLGILVEDASGVVRATWFNQPFLRDKFRLGQRVRLSGKPRLAGQRWEFAHPRVAWLAEDEPDDAFEGLLPVYPLTEGVNQHQMRRLVGAAVERHADAPDEVLPDVLREANDLLPLAEALRTLHKPQDAKGAAAARRRFVFQELFVLQLALAARRHQQRVGFRAPELPIDAQLDARIRRLFPFELTEGQRAAIADVAADVALDTPMNRLLQGDVGSGKTVVAVYAMLACVARGWQAALLAPTEVLARQHAHTLESMLRASRVRSRMMVGGQTEGEKALVRAGLAAGDVDLVIGTHALLEDRVEFAKLGLVVIDEQHKFGVHQRAALRSGTQSPHYLVMTATPIPRTMSMTQFGDLDVSSIRGMPPGRQEVGTHVVTPDLQARWWEFVRRQLREGRQAFVVAPLVEESEAMDAESVHTQFERLTSGELEAFRVGLLHGRMPASDKDDAMESFRRGDTQVLVSTTVIEVGVDVPNATVMTIASPERFGLSQLHQLRGRVGRGLHAGFCGLVVGEGLSDAARERLEAVAATADGFALSEIDFRLRGPGDLFGARQSGLPPLRIADLDRDRGVLEEARDSARGLFAADPGLKSPEHALLRRQMLRRYGASLELGDVG
ncbi:MAG: ATP-dependent DNA helicase RecG [Lacipirellulaceae bacterium]